MLPLVSQVSWQIAVTSDWIILLLHLPDDEKEITKRLKDTNFYGNLDEEVHRTKFRILSKGKPVPVNDVCSHSTCYLFCDLSVYQRIF